MTEERSSLVRLDGIGAERLEVVRKNADDWLAAKADDLPKIISSADLADKFEREVEELGALGRLVSGLERGAIAVPDPMVRELVSREAGEHREFDKVKEEYERLLAEYEGWGALLSLIGPSPESSAVGDEKEAPPAEPELGVEEDDEPAPGDWISLEGKLPDDQLAIVRRAVTGHLAGRAGDLPLLSRHEEPEREVSEIAALARLAYWLERGKVRVPDAVVQRVAARLADSIIEMNESGGHQERYEEGKAEEAALVRFAAIFPDPPETESSGESEASP